MKWMISEDRLDPEQREIIKEIGRAGTKRTWIKGHAGSGKSILLLHTLSDYLAEYPDARVCICVYTHALIDLLTTGIEQVPALRNKQISIYTIFELKRKIEAGNQFDAIFCDEVQDLPTSFLTQINSAGKLVVAGDATQSIYASVVTFNVPPATPDEIRSLIQPIEKDLLVVYRLSRSVLGMLTRVFPALFGSRHNASKNDTSIDVYSFAMGQENDELKFVWETAKESNDLRPGDVSAVLINKRDDIVMFCNNVLALEGKPQWTIARNFENIDFGRLNRHLAEHGIPLMYLGSKYGSLREADRKNCIVIMTYHSAKGLDFDAVYLPLTSTNMYFAAKAQELVLVALSRSKNDLLVSYSGNPHPVFQRFIGGIPVKQSTTRTTTGPANIIDL